MPAGEVSAAGRRNGLTARNFLQSERDGVKGWLRGLAHFLSVFLVHFFGATFRFTVKFLLIINIHHKKALCLSGSVSRPLFSFLFFGLFFMSARRLLLYPELRQ